MTKEIIIYWSTWQDADKTLHVARTEKGLCLVTLPNETFAVLEEWVQKQAPHATLQKDAERLAPYLEQLGDYLAGVRTEFDVPLDLRGTPFQIAVWEALCRIPYGTTVSYSDIAVAIGKSNAVRAVGAAIGANPVPLFVPCHRAVGKDGSLTGYQGGLPMKAELLRMESSRQVPLLK